MNHEEALARYRRASADARDAHKSLVRARELFRRATDEEAKAQQQLDLSVPCPFCGVQAGERCDSNVRPAHGVRRELARREVER